VTQFNNLNQQEIESSRHMSNQMLIVDNINQTINKNRQSPESNNALPIEVASCLSEEMHEQRQRGRKLVGSKSVLQTAHASTRNQGLMLGQSPYTGTTTQHTKERKVENRVGKKKGMTKSLTHTQLSISPNKYDKLMGSDMGLFKLQEPKPTTLTSQATDIKKNEERIPTHFQEEVQTGRSKLSIDSSQVFFKFEKTMREVRDSLNASPINYTQRRQPNKITSILEQPPSF